ncbi:hypothetical protein BD414DRAFT_489236 [Trametes punicea]|nr:hypothetical protein BD414DRAFT_489236 [Trametes punicea]
MKRDVEAAEKCCSQEALEIDPDCEAAVATLAQLSLQQGKIDVALKMFDRQPQLARSEPELISALTYQIRYRGSGQVHADVPGDGGAARAHGEDAVSLCRLRNGRLVSDELSHLLIFYRNPVL